MNRFWTRRWITVLVVSAALLLGVSGCAGGSARPTSWTGLTIAGERLYAADLEQVQVLNFNNGERMITYAISAPRGSGTVLLNGPAARRGMVGDLISVLSYCDITDEEARQLEPKVILVNEKNRPRGR